MPLSVGMDNSWLNLTGFSAILILLIVYNTFKYVYRVTLHPLAGFPGPFLAALTYKYEFYFEGIKGGMYTNKIKELHEIYGPVIRINPDELHCNDSNFVDQIYAGAGKRRDKWSYLLNGFGPSLSKSSFGTVSHDLHRIRRAATNRFFSKATITKFEPVIHRLAQTLCDKILQKASKGVPFDIMPGYSCFTTDIITYYCFGGSHGFLDQDDFEPNLRESICSSLKFSTVGRQWPLMIWFLEMLPNSIVKALNPQLSIWVDYIQSMTNRIQKIKQAHDEGREKELKGAPTIFREILQSNLPDEEKTADRLGSEASTLIAAGTETTAWTLGNLTFYILSEERIRLKLEEELQTVVTDPKFLPSWAVLEQLPYFIMMIEAMRLSNGVSHRLARRATGEALIYKGTFTSPDGGSTKPVELVIPPGTPIGMSSYIMHSNASIFPQPDRFLPERWLNEDGTRRRELETHMISFSRGSRQCLGINLAYCELHIILAALILRVFPTVKLFDTTQDDVKYHHDMFISLPKPDSLGVRLVSKDL